jgi:hypothetical protein
MCMVSFSWAYYSIVNRYQNTITSQFFSHTHNDEFMIFYNETDSKQPVSFNKYLYLFFSSDLQRFQLLIFHRRLQLIRI